MKNMAKPFALREIHYQLWTQIKLFIDAHGYSPSIRELMRLMGWNSSSFISLLLSDLEAEGCIRRTPGRTRTIVLVRLPDFIKSNEEAE